MNVKECHNCGLALGHLPMLSALQHIQGCVKRSEQLADHAKQVMRREKRKALGKQNG